MNKADSVMEIQPGRSITVLCVHSFNEINYILFRLSARGSLLRRISRINATIESLGERTIFVYYLWPLGCIAALLWLKGCANDKSIN